MLAIASVSHARRGSGSRGTIRVNSITAGTLLTTFDSSAAVALSPATVCDAERPQRLEDPPIDSRALDGPDHDEEPDEQHQQIPVDRGVDLRAARTRRVTSSTAAPAAATIAVS